MDLIEITPDLDGRWMVVMPGCIVGDLTLEVAQAFVAAYHRMKAMGAL